MEPVSLNNNTFDKKKILPLCILGVLTFILYGNTVFNGYALDDSMAITHNRYTRQGFAGIGDILTHNTWEGFYNTNQNISFGGRYRPLSVVTFAIEHQFFKLNPHVSHFVNVLLFAITVLLLFLLCERLSIPLGSAINRSRWYLSLPFVTAVLFLCHPVHTEIVANIKGRDDILAFLFSLITLLIVIRILKTGTDWLLGVSACTFLLALLSKEGAIVFVALIPLTTRFFTGTSLKRTLFITLPLLASSAIYLVIRYTVIDTSAMAYTANDLINNPFLEASTAEKYATIFYTLGIYLKLLFIPHPLTVDYYPYHIPLMHWGDLRVMLSLLIYISLIIFALFGLKKRSVVSYTIFVYLIPLAPVSNILFPVGVFMSERFLYVPSFAFCLLVTWLLLVKLPLYMNMGNNLPRTRYETGLSAFLVIVFLGFSLKTIHRNMAWKDDYTLLSADVKTSANSAFSNNAFGQLILTKSSQTTDSVKIQEYLRTAIHHFRKTLKIDHGHEEAMKYLGIIYEKLGKIDSTIYYLERFTETNQNTFDNYTHLGFLYGKEKGNIDKAIYWFEKAIQLEPGNPEPYLILSNILKNHERPEIAIEYLHRALEHNPAELHALQNICYLYATRGEYLKIDAVCEKAYNVSKGNKNLRKKIVRIYNNAMSTKENNEE